MRVIIMKCKKKGKKMIDMSIYLVNPLKFKEILVKINVVLFGEEPLWIHMKNTKKYQMEERDTHVSRLQVANIVILNYESLGLHGWRHLMIIHGETKRSWHRRTNWSFIGHRTPWMLLMCRSHCIKNLLFPLNPCFNGCWLCVLDI